MADILATLSTLDDEARRRFLRAEETFIVDEDDITAVGDLGRKTGNFDIKRLITDGKNLILPNTGQTSQGALASPVVRENPTPAYNVEIGALTVLSSVGEIIFNDIVSIIAPPAADATDPRIDIVEVRIITEDSPDPADSVSRDKVITSGPSEGDVTTASTVIRKIASVQVKIQEGVAAPSPVAPAQTVGFAKIAELHIPANATVIRDEGIASPTEGEIFAVTAFLGGDNVAWDAEKSITVVYANEYDSNKRGLQPFIPDQIYQKDDIVHENLILYHSPGVIVQSVFNAIAWDRLMATPVGVGNDINEFGSNDGIINGNSDVTDITIDSPAPVDTVQHVSIVHRIQNRPTAGINNYILRSLDGSSALGLTNDPIGPDKINDPLRIGVSQEGKGELSVLAHEFDTTTASSATITDGEGMFYTIPIEGNQGKILQGKNSIFSFWIKIEDVVFTSSGDDPVIISVILKNGSQTRSFIREVTVGSADADKWVRRDVLFPPDTASDSDPVANGWLGRNSLWGSITIAFAGGSQFPGVGSIASSAEVAAEAWITRDINNSENQTDFNAAIGNTWMIEQFSLNTGIEFNYTHAPYSESEAWVLRFFERGRGKFLHLRVADALHPAPEAPMITHGRDSFPVRKRTSPIMGIVQTGGSGVVSLVGGGSNSESYSWEVSSGAVTVAGANDADWVWTADARLI